MKGTFGLLFAVIFSANAWSAVRNPFKLMELQPPYHAITAIERHSNAQACREISAIIRNIADLMNGPFFNDVCNLLKREGVKVYSGPALCQNLTFGPPAAKSLRHEYDSLQATIEIVKSLDAAIDHIHKCGSSHTDVVITENENVAKYFIQQVDSACVFHNASSRFAVGYRFGLCAEVECMHVTSEEGGYMYKKNAEEISPHIQKEFDLLDSGTSENTVCGLYVVADPDKLIEITIQYMNANCESGGLMAFVDGWELNGQYFPGIEDHALNLDKRITEFCNDNKHWPLKQFNRVYRSSQNAALLQYRMPIRGSFVATVRFIHNPNPCNIMAAEVSPIYSLVNVGNRNNCTLTALYPAVVSIKNVNVGGNEQHLSYDCEQNKLDKIVIGGSNGLDSAGMEKASSICGHSEKPGPEQGIFCGVTSVRLSSSGNYVNQAIVSIRPADESDMSIATLVC